MFEGLFSSPKLVLAYGGMTPEIRPFLDPSTSFPVHYSLNILPFDATYSEAADSAIK
jgi:hypothetical protein